MCGCGLLLLLLLLLMLVLVLVLLKRCRLIKCVALMFDVFALS